MKRQTVLITSLALLASLCIFHLLTWRHLEITDSRLFSIYRNASFILFGCVLLTMAVFAPQDYAGQFSRLLVMISALCAGFLYLALSVFSPFPKDTIDIKALYVDKENPARQIIEQITYAGVFGSDRHDTIIIKQLMENVRWRNDIDMSRVDLSHCALSNK